MTEVMRKKANQPPGTLNYTGLYHDAQYHIDVIQYSEGEYRCYAIEDIREIFNRDQASIYWVNITGLHNTDQIRIIGEEYGIHRLDLEDIVHVSLHSKIESKPHYVFSAFKMVYLKDEQIIHEHLSMLLLQNVLFTFQEIPGDVFDTVRDRLKKHEGQIRQMGVDYLYYSLLDCLVDQFFDIVHHVAEHFEDIETAVIEYNAKKMDEMYQLRKELLFLRTTLKPLEDTLSGFVRQEHALFSREVKHYFSDISDHIRQTLEMIVDYREMVNSLYEMQLSNSSSQMNKTMMTLTVFSAIFIPLSFLAGVFGMNFHYIPGLANPHAFSIFAAACVAIGLGMLIVFKIKKWF